MLFNTVLGVLLMMHVSLILVFVTQNGHKMLFFELIENGYFVCFNS